MKKSGVKMDTVVISLGGSVLVPNEDDAHYIKSLVNVLRTVSEKQKLYIVTGGGKIARYYISVGRALGTDERDLDELGIKATRLNASLLIKALGGLTNPEPAKNFDEALEAGKIHKIVIMGGTKPGHTTDAVSAMLAEKVGAARLINATAVDGVYDSDPKKNQHAKKFQRMSHQELLAITSKSQGIAGPTVIFDPKGSDIIAKAKIALFVCHGRDLENLKQAILGDEFKGTVVE
jgi:uridylate kinase